MTFALWDVVQTHSCSWTEDVLQRCHLSVWSAYKNWMCGSVECLAFTGFQLNVVAYTNVLKHSDGIYLHLQRTERFHKVAYALAVQYEWYLNTKRFTETETKCLNESKSTDLAKVWANISVYILIKCHSINNKLQETLGWKVEFVLIVGILPVTSLK